MIPKKIHLCWFSGDEYPDKIQRCIDSWGKVLPDYEIILWDKDKALQIGNKWVRQAISERKYAFATDCLRFYALYHYGGVYMDSDVEVLKSFDDLLGLKYFVGKENSVYNYEAAVLGAEPHQEWVLKCLDYYKNRSFVNIFGEYRQSVLPYVMHQRLKDSVVIKDINSIKEFDNSQKVICRFPVDWFSPKKWETGEIVITDNTYCIHHFESSWQKTKGYKENVNWMTSLLRNLKVRASFVKHKMLKL